MKRNLIFALLALLLLCTACGKLPETGPFGNIASTSLAVEQDGILYFIYPVGPVYEPAGVAAYDVESGEFRQIPDPVEEEIFGIQVDGDTLYTLTDSGLYRSGLNGEDWTVLNEIETEEDIWNCWFFLLGDRIILGRCELVPAGVEGQNWMRIYSVSPKNGKETLLAQVEGVNFYHGSLTCYWDGKLYARNQWDFNEVLSLDLKSGEVQSVYTGDEVSTVYANRNGVAIETIHADGRMQYHLDGSSEDVVTEGYFLGSDGDNNFFQNTKYQHSSITMLEDGELRTLVEKYEWDMVTEPNAMSVGSYVLFYTREDLTGDGEPGDRKNLVHYLYLVDSDGNLKKIGSYTQDFLYS